MPPDEPAVRLPQNPSLNLLSSIAKQLRKAHRSGDTSVYGRIQTHHPAHNTRSATPISEIKFSLRDAQLVIAREHGFDNWADMKRHIELARSTVADIPHPPQGIDQIVPLFGVSDMSASLAHYVDSLGFEMTGQWVDDGRLAWCRLEHGSVAVMLQQYRTEGANARVFEGRRGSGVRLACLPGGDDSDWPHHGHLEEVADPDEYTLMASENAFQTTTFQRAVLVLDVVNMATSIQFYVEGLGFAETDRWAINGEPTRCRMSSGSAVLLLQALSAEQRQEIDQSDKRGQGVGISLSCDDAIAHYRSMKSRGVSPNEPYVGNQLWNVSVTDPDGYRMSFQSQADRPEETTLSEIEA